MKKILSVMISGAVIAACAGFAVAAEPSTGSEMMKQVDKQQDKITEKEGRVTEAIKKKDKAKENVQNKKMKIKELKESKAKPTEKITKAAEEGEKGMQEMKDMKKELK